MVTNAKYFYGWFILIKFFIINKFYIFFEQVKLNSLTVDYTIWAQISQMH